MKVKRHGKHGARNFAIILGLFLIMIIGIAIWASSSTPSNPLLRCVGDSQVTYHIHSFWRIDYNGKQLGIPALVGFDSSQQCFLPMHTHTNSGVVHIETPGNMNLNISDFFFIWSHWGKNYPTGANFTSFTYVVQPGTYSQTGTDDSSWVWACKGSGTYPTPGCTNPGPSYVTSSYVIQDGDIIEVYGGGP